MYQLKEKSLLGVFYSSFFGGLFFVFLPMEVLFVSLLKDGVNPTMLIILYIVGFLLSYSINYFIGMNLGELSKKLIGAKQFYNIKVAINRYGVLAVFAFNALPLPSQALSTILGVFKYNKTKFYIFFLSGQLIKYIVIAIGYIYIF
jgi:membrane protein YqaA with SNARE-associated domain